MNNENAQTVQKLVNNGALANIQANGEINTAITNLTNNNRTLLQTSQGAASIYSQSLQSMSAIMQNKDLDAGQKQAALNNSVQQLNDALAALSTIAGIPAVTSLLNFGSGEPAAAPAGGGGLFGYNATTGQYTDSSGNVTT
jgi:hypothetical protein